MAERARARRVSPLVGLSHRIRQDPSSVDFSGYLLPGEPPDILPQILAARCLGIEYGDPGPKLPPEVCRQCWGERYVWRGNCWGTEHQGDVSLFDCRHECHEGEVWLG